MTPYRVPPRRWMVALVVAATLPAVAPALAQPERVPLAWNAPSGCPTAAQVLADVERNTAAAGEGHAPFVAVVNVTDGTKGLWQARLRVETRGGLTERQFEAESCQAIASATALIIGLASQLGQDGQVEGGGRAATPGAANPEAKQPAASEDHWQRGRRSLMVSGIVDGGITPKTAAGAEVAGGPSWTAPGWRLRVLGSGAFFFPRSADLPGVYGDFWRLAVSGRGCASAGARFEVGLCVGAELSAMHSHGPMDSGLSDDTRYWLSPTASALTTWNLDSRLAIFVRADVSVPAWHPSFQTDAGSDIYTVPLAAAGAALGVELNFP